MTYILCFINKGPMTLSLFAQQMQHQLREILVLCQNTAPPPPILCMLITLLWLCSQSTSRQSQNAKTFLPFCYLSMFLLI